MSESQSIVKSSFTVSVKLPLRIQAAAGMNDVTMGPRLRSESQLPSTMSMTSPGLFME